MFSAVKCTMVDFRRAKDAFEAIGKNLKFRNIRPQDDEGKFIKKITDACTQDADSCIYVTNEGIITTVMQSQRSCVEADELCQVKCVLFTSVCRRLIKDDADIDKVIKILTKSADEDKRCCVCMEVSSGLNLHCQSCTSPICKDCFLGISLANGRRSTPDDEDDDDDFDDFHEPTHDIPCPTCRTKVSAYRWMTEACLPKTTRTFANFDMAIKAVITASKAPFMMGSVMKHFLSDAMCDDIDYDDDDDPGFTKLDNDVIATRSLGALWVQDNKVLFASKGLEGSYSYLENLEGLEEDCAAMVLGKIPTCICCAHASDKSGTVLVKIGNLVHDISETFPLYASYIAINNNFVKNLKKEEDEEQIYYRIHRSVDEAKKRWDATWKKEREELLKIAENSLSEFREAADKKLNAERERFLEIATLLKDKEPAGYFECRKLELLTKMKQIEFDRLSLLNSSTELRMLEFTRLNSMMSASSSAGTALVADESN